ncbi:hypothetical protein IMG5_175400 [Ichthyophthirius multifiliis]|uniref:Uncharacterized protein n=1 Tax=Ichthyophthirius multifiliis TaxID=5932 RepID=G0R265_ICHMU|nr:hypothetical protein IMG5_175400 [Ichthyophthirius multifiliis]EGR28445.1 hypothetical protein IMG5_175400 [Ichthyophthirius multifiliis]|eukprot:XP_004029681.1 hypothetical protein IMG5_175400 [Ichthyophthirius multifiliis]
MQIMAMKVKICVNIFIKSQTINSKNSNRKNIRFKNNNNIKKCKTHQDQYVPHKKLLKKEVINIQIWKKIQYVYLSYLEGRWKIIIYWLKKQKSFKMKTKIVKIRMKL